MHSWRSQPNSISESGSNYTLTKAPSRINKNHGFMKFIVQNQLDRSEYENFIKNKRRSEITVDQLDKSCNTTTTYRFSLGSRESKADLPDDWDPHFEMRMKLRSKIEKEHKNYMDWREKKNHLYGSSVEKNTKMKEIHDSLSKNKFDDVRAENVESAEAGDLQNALRNLTITS